jgi:hypothetical protein
MDLVAYDLTASWKRAAAQRPRHFGALAASPRCQGWSNSNVTQALPNGGALIVYDNTIDDERRHRPNSLLASLNMLIETAGGFEYTDSECSAWMHEAGFCDIRIERLDRIKSAVIGIK